jgi:Tfp pilus assembly protein PilV
MINSLPKVNGQGLLETLIVILFVTASVVALLSFQHYLSINSNISQNQSIAVNLGVQQIETVRNFTVLTTTTGYTAYSDIANGSSTATVGNTAYTMTWVITNTATPAYKTINMTVSWTDRNGASRSINLVTFIAGIDPANSANVF